MDRLTNIEDKLGELLLTIDKNIVPISGAYQYKTLTGTVQIDDQALSLAKNTDKTAVNYTIEGDTIDTVTAFTYGQNAYMSTVDYKIVAKVQNINTTSNPIRDIKAKMNEVISDLKYLFYMNYLNNNTAEIVLYKSAEKVIHPSNNKITSGTVTVTVSVTYSQQGNNPDRPACNY